MKIKLSPKTMNMNELLRLKKEENEEIAILTMEVTPFMENLIRERMDLEIEILQGERIPLYDGRVKITVEISDLQKAERIKKFILAIIANGEHVVSPQ